MEDSTVLGRLIGDAVYLTCGSDIRHIENTIAAVLRNIENGIRRALTHHLAAMRKKERV